MLEYEKKIILTKSEYDTIIYGMSFRYIPFETQTNYYFDNDNFSMNEKGITCRIRAKDGKYKATVKNHNIEHPDCSFEVDLVEKSEFDPQIFNVFGLHYQGELVTDRVVLYNDSACQMVLDRNIYLDNTDFELEIEYHKDEEQKAQSLIENIARQLVEAEQLKEINEFLKRVGKGKSKAERFFERKQKIF